MRVMRGVYHKGRKTAKNLLLMFGLNETIDQLAMASSVRWHGHVLSREDGHALGKALEFQVEGQKKNGGEGHEISRLRKKL